ncbi:MAG: class I SAM-dependent methyltransferase [Actinobacteria bacterium]|nr:class I SAM-dependent methyltransferase [Actinomycetota bacterium]
MVNKIEQINKDHYKEHWQLTELGKSKREQLRAQTVLSLIPPGTKSVLEVGCGDGFIINQVKGIPKMGLDIEPEALKKVSSPTTEAPVSAIPFEDRSWELVVASEILEHISPEDYNISLEEISRVAGRSIIVTVPNHEQLSSGYARCEQCRKVYHRNHHQRSYSRQSLEKLFKDFSIVGLSEIGEPERKRTKLENVVRQRVFNNWATCRNSICPFCGANYFSGYANNTGTRKTPEHEWRTKKLLADLTGCRRSPWIAILYTRNNI